MFRSIIGLYNINTEKSLKIYISKINPEKYLFSIY